MRVARTRATSSEWHSYYERAARVRAVVGDSFKHHVERVKARERTLWITTGLFIAVATAAFGVLALQ
jgi:hypothetical protein